jgi:hypothetical protein
MARIELTGSQRQQWGNDLRLPIECAPVSFEKSARQWKTTFKRPPRGLLVEVVEVTNALVDIENGRSDYCALAGKANKGVVRYLDSIASGVVDSFSKKYLDRRAGVVIAFDMYLILHRRLDLALQRLEHQDTGRGILNLCGRAKRLAVYESFREEIQSSTRYLADAAFKIREGDRLISSLEARENNKFVLRRKWG